MSAVLEQPTAPPITDPTAGIELVQSDEGQLDATRHLFLAANLLDPARQRDIGLTDGGEELDNRCLKRTSGRLPKCEITPLEFWVEWMPKDLFPEGMEHMALTLKDGSEPIGANNRIFKPLFGYPYYPAHTIVDALGIATGERRGVVELENLRGVVYGKEDREMQNLFFPADWPRPIELRLIEERIARTAESVADPDVHATANFMLASVAQSREYMEVRVSQAQTQLAERKSHEYVHRLTPKIRSFMAQLEIKPMMATSVQDTVDRAVATSLPPEVLEQLAANSAALTNLGPSLGEAIGSAVKEAVAAALAAAKPAAPAKPAKSTE